MIVRTGLTPYHRDVNNNGVEKNTRASGVFTSNDPSPVPEKTPQSKAIPPVEQTIEGEILDRRRQRQYSENTTHFRTDTQDSDPLYMAYNSRALAAYQSNILLAAPQYQAHYEQIDYFA